MSASELASLREDIAALRDRIDMMEGVNFALSVGLNFRAYAALAKPRQFSLSEFATINRFEGMMADAIIEHLEVVTAQSDEAINEAFVIGLKTVVDVLRKSRDKT